MAVNLLLRERPDVDPVNDPMGRSRVGWDNYATDDELWDINRGLWSLARGAAEERFATLSYKGVIQVVVEITGRTQHALPVGTRWTLSGNVLRPGDPVRDELVGTAAPRSRNPVSYFDTSRLDSMPTNVRAQMPARQPVTMLATWNPKHWDQPDYAADVRASASGRIVRGRWATGNRKAGVEPGDRVFLMLQGDGPRGILGSGTCTSRILPDGHWDQQRVADEAHYVLIEWDSLVSEDDALPRTDLMARIPAGGEWRPQSSGTLLTPPVAASLEQLWAQHLGQHAPGPRSQGWQLDPARRKKVENAAQERLTQHYEAQGWTVKDTRYGNSYDAIATKQGQTHYLEAKGTETTGSAVIVSRGEVNFARNHPGQCMIGILSDIQFLPGDEVDPMSGTFRIVNWNPDAGNLAPREYDWTPPDATAPNRRVKKPAS
jgi:hypothetical protein